MATIETAWRSARAELSGVPPLVVRGWVQEGLNKLCDKRNWSFLRTEAQIVINPSRTITINVTQGSTTVTAAASTFLSSDVGRQIRGASAPALGTIPIYTIITVAGGGASATLDIAWGDISATGVLMMVYDGYFTVPANFRYFLVVLDRYYLRTIPFWLSEDELAVADPGRVFSDQGPRYLVSQDYAPAGLPNAGQPRYEYWPAPATNRVYPFLYIRAADQLADNANLPGVLSTRPDLFKTYCLYRAALWPGTGDQKNPSYNLSAANAYKAEWEAELQSLSLIDDAQYPEDLLTVHWMRRQGAIAPTATLLRQTDATINDYF